MMTTSLFFLFLGGAFGYLAGVFCKERQFQNEWITRYQDCLTLREELLAELDRARRQHANANQK